MRVVQVQRRGVHLHKHTHVHIFAHIIRRIYAVCVIHISAESVHNHRS